MLIFSLTLILHQGGGKRPGSIATYLECHHPDIEAFLDLRKNSGNEHERCRDLFLALWVSDLFMERVEAGGDWSLFCPAECPGLSDLHGDEYKHLYELYEQGSRARKTLSARSLWNKIVTSQIETGTPYILFKDACNSKSNQKNLGTIKCSNLCVAPHTPILTYNGYYPIASLAGQTVRVWNGAEFSETTVMQTGTDQEMLRVRFSNTVELDCTPYHKFHIVTGARNTKHKVVEAAQLVTGDRLVKCDFPVIRGGSDVNDMAYPYTHGFFCGDGTYTSFTGREPCLCIRDCIPGENYCTIHLMYTARGECSGAPEGQCQAISNMRFPTVTLCGAKKNLVPFLEIRSGTGIETADCKLTFNLPVELSPKFTVPINASVQCRLQWLAGLADADGCVVTVDGNESIQISSVHLKMLQEVMLMLQTLGMSTYIGTMHLPGIRSLPDGQGGIADYQCQQVYRISISNRDLIKLHNLGFQTHRLKFNLTHQPNRNASRFVRVVSVEKLAERSDTYCFNEPKRHRGIFAGVITGNCSEVRQQSV